MPTPYVWFDTLKVWQTFKDVKGSWRKSEKNRFSFSYKSCSKVFSTSFTFKSSHERMEVTEVAVVNSVCFWLPFNGDRSGELGLQGFWQQTRQLKPPRILLRTSLHLWNDFPFKQTMSLWGKQEFIWEPDRYPPNSEGTFNDFFFIGPKVQNKQEIVICCMDFFFFLLW